MLRSLAKTSPTQMLFLAGIESTTYDLENDRLLLTLQEGWRGYEAREFLFTQKLATVLEVEWDNVKYPNTALPPSPRSASPHKKAAKKSKSTTASARAPSVPFRVETGPMTTSSDERTHAASGDQKREPRLMVAEALFPPQPGATDAAVKGDL